MLPIKLLLPVVISLLADGLLFSAVEAKKVTLLDEIGNEDIGFIAKIACDTTKGVEKQISRLSTVVKLTSFLGTLKPDHKLYKCREKYMRSIQRLEQVLKVGNANVCDGKKIRLIENFHRDYVSQVAKFEEKRGSSNLAIPKVIRLLFIQYATWISTLCEKEAMKLVERYDPAVEAEEKSMEGELDRAMEHFMGAIGMTDLSAGYDSIYLVWNLVDSLPLEKSEKLARYVLNRDQPTRLHAQLREASDMHSLQRFCRMMKPVYGGTILPVLRLIDLGYYPLYSQLPEMISMNPPFRRKYILTQMCETLEPIKFYPTDTMQAGQISMLTQEDAEKLPQPEFYTERVELSRQKEDRDLSYLSVMGQDQVATVMKDQAAQLAANIKLQVEARGEAFARVLKVLMLNMKKHLKNKGEFFVGSDSNGSVQDLESLLEDAGLNEIEESDAAAGGKRRFKRGSDEKSLDKMASRKKYFKNVLKGTAKVVLQFCMDMIETVLMIIGHVFLLAIKVTDVFVVLLYRIWRHVVGGRGYRPLERILETAWNSGFSFTKEKLDLYDPEMKYMGESSDEDKH